MLIASLLVAGRIGATPAREAQDLVVDDAVSKMKAGDLEAARHKLQMALMVEVTPRRLYHLALVEREMGHRATALRVARRFEAHPDVDPRRRAAFEKGFMEELIASTARVTVEAPRGGVVEVDDYAGEAPLPIAIDVEPGERIIRLKVDGREVDARGLSLKAGDSVHVVLHPRDARAEAAAPAPSSDPSTARERARTADSYRPVAGYVVPSAMLGAAAVALGFGVGYAVASNRAHDEAEALGPGTCVDPSSPQCAAQRARVARVNTLGDTSVGLYVASGALAAGAIVSFLVWPSSRRDLRITASPTGLGVSGRF